MMPITSRLHLWVLLLALALPDGVCWASDWPQFLGPNRNGTITGEPLADHWPKEGPPILWQRAVGAGFSGPVVSSGKLVLCARTAEKETVECMEAETGKSCWIFQYPTGYVDDFGFDEGPRATPTISDGKVYTFGAEGTLHCLDFTTGNKIWSVSIKKEFQAPKGFFGMVCSPLVEDDCLLLNIGGRGGAGIVAFEKNSGRLLWKATEDEASYSSPVAANIQGQRSVIFFTRSGLEVVDPKAGTIRYSFPWRSRMNASVNAATPLVVDDYIFLSASYQTGAVLLQADGKGLKRIWSGDDIVSNHYATSVHHNGFLYGFDGRQEQGQRLRCVELKTGKIRWTAEDIGAGTVTLADNRLLLLTEKGELILADASPDGFVPKARAQVLPKEVRAYPALADARLYARSKAKLSCIDLRPKGSSPR